MDEVSSKLLSLHQYESRRSNGFVEHIYHSNSLKYLGDRRCYRVEFNLVRLSSLVSRLSSLFSRLSSFASLMSGMKDKFLTMRSILLAMMQNGASKTLVIRMLDTSTQPKLVELNSQKWNQYVETFVQNEPTGYDVRKHHVFMLRFSLLISLLVSCVVSRC